MVNKKTLVIGASTNPERYSYKAIKALKKAGHEVLALGAKDGEIDGIIFKTNKELIEDLDTITMYINPKTQEDYKEYILSLKPKRVIFNPGTENMPVYKDLTKAGINVEEACTLVLLSIDNY